MPYTKQYIDAIRVESIRIAAAEVDLEIALRKVLDSPKYNCLNNEWKAGVLLKLENNGEYDPEG